MTNYNLILITTHQDKLHILKLIDSIDDNIKNIKVLLVVVSQECKLEYKTKNSLLTIVFIDEEKMGLSKARNIALKYLLNNNLSAEYIMFPDDDSSFDVSFFIHFPSILGSNKCYITPIYNEGTKDLYLGKKTVDNTSSINRFSKSDYFIQSD
jgi:glycosyltransferase involved in cell wall biosynthesis